MGAVAVDTKGAKGKINGQHDRPTSAGNCTQAGRPAPAKNYKLS